MLVNWVRTPDLSLFKLDPDSKLLIDWSRVLCLFKLVQDSKLLFHWSRILSLSKLVPDSKSTGKLLGATSTVFPAGCTSPGATSGACMPAPDTKPAEKLLGQMLLPGSRGLLYVTGGYTISMRNLLGTPTI
jgi:hypothetical protein